MQSMSGWLFEWTFVGMDSGEKGRRVFARGLGCRWAVQRFLPLPFFLLLELLAPAPLEEAPLDEALAAAASEPTGVHSACLWRFQSAARHSCEQ